jgi:hypothetical protein
VGFAGTTLVAAAAARGRREAVAVTLRGQLITLSGWFG